MSVDLQQFFNRGIHSQGVRLLQPFEDGLAIGKFSAFSYDAGSGSTGHILISDQYEGMHASPIPCFNAKTIFLFRWLSSLDGVASRPMVGMTGRGVYKLRLAIDKGQPFPGPNVLENSSIWPGGNFVPCWQNIQQAKGTPEKEAGIDTISGGILDDFPEVTFWSRSPYELGREKVIDKLDI